MSQSAKPKKILFQLSGSIAAYKACDVVSRLVKKGYEVQCVATRSALKFVGDSTLEGLTGNPVLSDLYEKGRQMDHIHLERDADLLLLCPATASTINKLVTGLGDDLVSTLFLAHEFKKPYLIAPAMNHAMYNHPVTQASLKKLSSWGVELIPPEEGELACGENGAGRLASPESIVNMVEARLSEEVAETEEARPKVLVTFGGTEEPIDEVRTLANFSRGQTGAMICDYLSEAGYEVTAVASEKAIKSKKHNKLITFQSFFDLNSILQKALSETKYDSVIHLAAVSDFSVESVEVNGVSRENVQRKLSSSDKISIHLKPNFKIVERIKNYAKNPSLQVIAFKLTKTPDLDERQQAVQKIISSESIDFVVHNELTEIHGMQHKFSIFDRNGVVTSGKSKTDLAHALHEIIASPTTKEFTDGPMP